MLKDIIHTLLPWIAYILIVGESKSQREFAIITALILSLIYEIKGLKKGFVISYGTLIFFIFLFIAVVMFQSSWVIKNTWLLLHITLALIAWISLLIKKPFTMQYAKEMVSADKWNSPLFIKINNILTVTWGMIFLFGILINVLHIYFHMFNRDTYSILTNIGFIFGIWFNVKFPEWYKKKYFKEPQNN